MIGKPIRALELHYPMMQFLAKTIYYMAESASGQHEANPLFWLASRAGKMGLLLDP